MKRETCCPVPDARFALALLILILFGATESYGDEALPRTFTNSLHGFRISLPNDWDRMPLERLEAFNEAARVQYPHWKQPALHYGYQMTNGAGLAFPPYAIIRVEDKPSDRKAVLAGIENDDLAQGVERRPPLFDDELNAYQFDMRAQVGGISADMFVTAFLTKKSVIKLFFSCPTNDLHFAAIAKDIAKNVRISDDIRIPAEHPMRGGLIFALVAMAVIVIVLSRAKPAKVPDSPSAGCG